MLFELEIFAMGRALVIVITIESLIWWLSSLLKWSKADKHLENSIQLGCYGTVTDLIAK